MFRIFFFLLLLPPALAAQTSDTTQNREIRLKEVSVEGNTTFGTNYTSREQLERIPTILGEKDILKYLATMPGIATTGALDPGIYVRGGNSSENTFFVNDIEVANPDHLSGILSTFDPYVLGRSVIYKSGFPAKYNGSLSSYLNMFSDSGEEQKYSGEATIGLLSSALKARGPIGRKGTSFAASVRGSYLQHMARLYNKVNGSSAMPAYSFYDATASVHSRPAENLVLDCFGLFTTDKLSLKDDLPPLEWNSFSANTRLRYTQGNHLFSLKIGFRTRYNQGQTQQRTDTYEKSRNNGFSAEAGYDRPLSEKLWINAGMKFENSAFNFGNNHLFQKNRFNLYTAYTSLKYEISPEWNAEGGINYQYYSGAATAGTWSPRFRLNFNPRICHVWVDYAKTTQYLSLYPFFTIKSPLDIWFPLSKDSRPAVCHQISIGADKQIFENLYVYAALFWKNMNRVKDFTYGLKSDFVQLENQQTEGSGVAKGTEFDLIYNTEKFYFRANYTLSESWRKFSDINNGQKFHPPYDMKHNLLVNASWQFIPKWTLNVLWTYCSGSYATFPVGVSIAQNINNSDGEPQFIPIYRERYNFKLPDNHRLDVSTSYLQKYKKLDLTLNLGVYNAYNQPNASFVYFKPEIKDKYFTRFTPQSRVLLPFIPYLSMTLTW